MEVPKALMIDGKEYSWDGQIFHHENKARAKARRYLRWRRRVHVEGQGGIYYIYTYRAIHWDDDYVKKGGQE